MCEWIEFLLTKSIFKCIGRILDILENSIIWQIDFFNNGKCFYNKNSQIIIFLSFKFTFSYILFLKM